MTDRPPLSIRFGRLGDLVLCWPALADLAARCGTVDLVTSRQYVDLMGALPWIGRVWSLDPAHDDLPGVISLAGEIRRAEHGPVIDLHASLRSRALCAALGGARRRVRKDSLTRRLQIGLRRGETRIRLGSGEVLDFPRRYLDAAGASAEAARIPVAPPQLVAPREAPKPRLAVLPGARRATKRWPADRFGALAEAWRGATGGTTVLFHGPGEGALSASVVAASSGAARVEPDRGLVHLLREMGRCAVAVGGDTGLLHLAAAAGASPVGLFGPTGVAMGYWPWDGRGSALAPSDPCHPCSLYGGDACPLGHHACLDELPVERVLATAIELLGANP